MAKKKEMQLNAPTGTGEIPDTSALSRSNLLPTLFAPSKLPEKKELRRLNLPPIIKPKQVGQGVSIQGKILKIVDSPVSTYKSKLLWCEHESGTEFCFPATCTVTRALLGEFKTLDAAIGSTILLTGVGQTKTTDGKRTVNLFEVFLVK